MSEDKNDWRSRVKAMMTDPDFAAKAAAAVDNTRKTNTELMNKSAEDYPALTVGQPSKQPLDLSRVPQMQEEQAARATMGDDSEDYSGVVELATKLYDEKRTERGQRAMQNMQQPANAFQSPIATAINRAAETNKAANIGETYNEVINNPSFRDAIMLNANKSLVKALEANPSMSQEEQQKLYNETIDKQLKQVGEGIDKYLRGKNELKGGGEYVLRSAIQNSLIGKAMQTAIQSASGSDGELAYQQQALADYDANKAKWWEQGLGIAGGLALDAPLMQGIGSAANATMGRATIWGLGKIGGKGLQMSTLGRMATGAAVSSGTLGGYNATSALANQLMEGRFDVGEIASSAGHGFMLGALTGAMSPWLRGVSSGMGKVGKVATMTGGLATEAGIFSGAELMEMENPYDLETMAQTFGKNVAVIGGLKVSNLPKTVKEYKQWYSEGKQSSFSDADYKLMADFAKANGFANNEAFSMSADGVYSRSIADRVTGNRTLLELTKLEGGKERNLAIEMYNDPNVPISLKTKIAAKMHLPAPKPLLANGIRVEGNKAITYCTMPNGAQQVIEIKEFARPRNARAFANEFNRTTARKNDLMQTEAAVNNISTEPIVIARLNEQAKRNGTTYEDELARLNAITQKAIDGTITAEDVAYYSSIVDTDISATEAIKQGIKDEYGVEIDDVLKSDGNLTDVQDKAMTAYADALRSITEQGNPTTERMLVASTSGVADYVALNRLGIEQTRQIMENPTQRAEIDAQMRGKYGAWLKYFDGKMGEDALAAKLGYDLNNNTDLQNFLAEQTYFKSKAADRIAANTTDVAKRLLEQGGRGVRFTESGKVKLQGVPYPIEVSQEIVDRYDAAMQGSGEPMSRIVNDALKDIIKQSETPSAAKEPIMEEMPDATEQPMTDADAVTQQMVDARMAEIDTDLQGIEADGVQRMTINGRPVAIIKGRIVADADGKVDKTKSSTEVAYMLLDENGRPIIENGKPKIEIGVKPSNVRVEDIEQWRSVDDYKAAEEQRIRDNNRLTDEAMQMADEDIRTEEMPTESKAEEITDPQSTDELLTLCKGDRELALDVAMDELNRAQQSKGKGANAAETMAINQRIRTYQRMVDDLSKVEETPTEIPTEQTTDTQVTDDMEFIYQKDLGENHEGMEPMQLADGRYKWVGLQRGELTTTMGERDAELLDGLAKKLGVAIIPIDVADSAVNGYYRDGNVYVNTNRGAEWTMRWVAGHELLHDVAKKSPEAYNAYKQAVLDMWGEDYIKSQVKQIIEDYKASGKEIDREQALTELVNDFGGELFSSRDGLKILDNILKDESRKGNTGFVNTIKQWWERLKEWFGGTPYASEVEKKLADAYKEAIANAEKFGKNLDAENNIVRNLKERPAEVTNDDLIANEGAEMSIVRDRNKQKQFDIISSTNPAHDDYHTWIRSTDDIKTLQEAVDEVRAEDPEYNLSSYPDVTDDMINEALQSGKVTVYSSNPIKEGVFVSPSKMQAKDYAGDSRVYSKQVSINDVAWINTDEGMFAPTSYSVKGKRADESVLDYAKRMAEEERKNSLLADTEDVSRDEQIVYGNTDADYSIKIGGKEYENDGYTQREDGTNLSVRALDAEEDGSFSRGNFVKAYKVAKKDFDLLQSLGVIKNTEWHHTGNNFRETDFFTWVDSTRNGGNASYSDLTELEPESIGAKYKANKKEIGALIGEYEKHEWGSLPKYKKPMPTLENFTDDYIKKHAVKELSSNWLTIEDINQKNIEQNEISKNRELYSPYERFQQHKLVDAKYEDRAEIRKKEWIEAHKEEIQEQYNALKAEIDKYNSNIASHAEVYANDAKGKYLMEILDLLGYSAEDAAKMVNKVHHRYNYLQRTNRAEQAREAVNREYAQKEAVMRQDFDKWFNKSIKDGKAAYVERLPNKPEFFITKKVEMNGKYGWFEASSRYNLPVYYSGYQFGSKRLYDSYIKRQSDIVKVRDEGIVKAADAYNKAIFDAESNTYFSVKANNELDKKSLVGIHNLTEDNLRYALNLGGLANPSTAVIDTNIMSLEGFGDISLIMPKSLVAKSSGKNAGTFAGSGTGKLTKSDEYFEVRQKIEDEFNALREDIANKIGSKSLEEAGAVLSSCLLDGFDYARKKYKARFSTEMQNRITDFGKLLRESPARYFETKFERPVMFNEFVAAIVPKDINPELRKALTDNGLAIEEYDRGDEASRLEAIRKASDRDDVQFSIKGGKSGLKGVNSDAYKRIIELAGTYYKEAAENENNPEWKDNYFDYEKQVKPLAETLTDEALDKLYNELEERFDSGIMIVGIMEGREAMYMRKRVDEQTKSNEKAVSKVKVELSALEEAVKSGNKSAIKKSKEALTEAVIKHGLGHRYMNERIYPLEQVKRTNADYAYYRALLDVFKKAMASTEAALNNAIEKAGLEGVSLSPKGWGFLLSAEQSSKFWKIVEGLDSNECWFGELDERPYGLPSDLPQLTMNNIDEYVARVKDVLGVTIENPKDSIERADKVSKEEKTENYKQEQTEQERAEYEAKEQWRKENAAAITSSFFAERRLDKADKIQKLKDEINKLIKETRATNKENSEKVKEIAKEMQTYIKENIPTETQGDMTRPQFEQVIKQLSTAITRKDLEKPMRMVEYIGANTNRRALTRQMRDFLKQGFKGMTPKGLVKAKNVDGATSRVLGLAKSLYESMGKQPLGSDLRALQTKVRGIKAELEDLNNANGGAFSEYIEQINAILKKSGVDRYEEMTKYYNELSDRQDVGEIQVSELLDHINRMLPELFSIELIKEQRTQAKADSAMATKEDLEQLRNNLEDKREKGILSEEDQAVLDNMAMYELMVNLQQRQLDIDGPGTSSIASQMAAKVREAKQYRDELEKYDDKQSGVAKNLKDNIKRINAEMEELFVQRTQAQKEVNANVAELLDNLKQLRDTGNSALKEWSKNKQERETRIVTMANASFGKDARGYWSEVDRRGGWKRDFSNRMNNLRLAALMSPALSFEYMVGVMDPRFYTNESPIYKQFIKGEDGLIKANDNFFEGLEAYNNGINEAVERFINRNAMQSLKEYFNKGDRFATEIIPFEFEVKENVNGEVVTSIVHRDAEMTRGRAAKIYAWSRMADGMAKLKAHGVTDETLEVVKAFIGQDYMDFIDWVEDEYFPKLRREKYNPIYKQMYGISMAENEHYFPFETYKKDIRTEKELEQINSDNLGGGIVGNIIERKRNNARLDFTDESPDIFDAISEYGRKMEEWAAYAQVREDLKKVINNKQFKQHCDMLGTNYYNHFLDAARVASRLYNPQPSAPQLQSAAAKLQKVFASAAISLRVSTALKQLLSAPAFAVYSLDPAFHKELLKTTSVIDVESAIKGLRELANGNKAEAKRLLLEENWVGHYNWCVNNLPSFRERVSKGGAGNPILEEKGWSKFSDDVQSVGMLPNRLVDAFTCSVGAKAIYEYAFNKYKKTYDEATAHNMAVTDAEIAFNSSQQSSNPVFLSPLQSSKEFWLRGIMNYKNSPIGYYRNGMKANIDLYRATKALFGKPKFTINGEQVGFESNGTNPAAKAAEAAAKSIMFNFFLNYLWAFGTIGIAGVSYTMMNNDDKDGNMLYTDEEFDKATGGNMGLAVFNAATQGIPWVSGFASVSQTGQDYTPSILFSEMNNYLEQVNKEGFMSLATAQLLIDLGLKNAVGVDPEVWGQIYRGAQGIMADRPMRTEDFMNLLASPRSAIAGVAKQKVGEYGNMQDYVNARIESEREIGINETMDLGKKLNGLRTLRKSKLDGYIDEYLADKIPDYRELANKPDEKTKEERMEESNAFKNLNTLISTVRYTEEKKKSSKKIDGNEETKDKVKKIRKAVNVIHKLYASGDASSAQRIADELERRLKRGYNENGVTLDDKLKNVDIYDSTGTTEQRGTDGFDTMFDRAMLGGFDGVYLGSRLD